MVEKKVVQTGLTNNTSGRYGYLFGSGGSSWTGSVHEILIYNRKINDTNRALIEGYLAHKWRTSYLLSDDHPYKFAGPVPVELPEQDYTIAITSGSGYAGSIYTHYFDEPGRWYLDNIAVAGTIGTQKTFTMTAADEGKIVEFRSDNYTSNQIQLFTPNLVTGLVSWFDTYIGSGWGTSKVGNHSISTAGVNYSSTGRNNLPAITSSGGTNTGTFNKAEQLPSGNRPHHIFTVAYSNAVTVERNLIVWGDYANTASRRVLGKDTNQRVYSYSGNTPLYSGVAPDATWGGNDRIVSASVSNGILMTHQLTMKLIGISLCDRSLKAVR
jgi:hypothetical protein